MRPKAIFVHQTKGKIVSLLSLKYKDSPVDRTLALRQFTILKADVDAEEHHQAIGREIEKATKNLVDVAGLSSNIVPEDWPLSSLKTFHYLCF